MSALHIVYSNTGAIRWGADAVGEIKWDPNNHVGEASVTDETTGTVYEIGEGGGGDSDFSTAQMTLSITGTAFFGEIEVIANDQMIYALNSAAESGVVTVVLYKGVSSKGTFLTKEPITTYSGDITLDEAELFDEMYETQFTVTGDCSVTLVGNTL